MLFVKDETYKYVYVFEWVKLEKYSFEGFKDVAQPLTNEFT